jgi:hypothetical protein
MQLNPINRNVPKEPITCYTMAAGQISPIINTRNTVQQESVCSSKLQHNIQHLVGSYQKQQL